MKDHEFISIVISSIALLASALSALFVYFQVKAAKKQLFLDNFTRISEVNRQLVSMGFSDPELFEILEGREISSTVKQKRYIQLWINQADIIYSSYRLGALDKQAWNALENDLGELFALELVRNHWKNVRPYYSEEMGIFVEQIIKRFTVIKISKPSNFEQDRGANPKKEIAESATEIPNPRPKLQGGFE